MTIGREDTDKIEHLLIDNKLDEAESIIFPLVEHHPESYDAWHKLAGLRAKRGEWGMAIEDYKKAIEISRYSESAWFGLAYCLWNGGMHGQALQAFRQLIAISPQHTEGLMMAGECHYKCGRFWDAYEYYERYTEIFPEKLNSMIGKMIVCLENAERERTDDVRVKIALWWNLEKIGNTRHADEVRLRAVHCNPRIYCMFYPDDPIGLAVKITHNMRVCNWQGWDEDIKHLREIIRNTDKACDPVFNTLGTTQEEQYVNTSRFVNWKYPDRSPYDPAFSYDHGGHITLGYISADFHEHATTHLVAGLLENHDRKKFRVLAFSTGRIDESPERKRVMNGVDTFYDISKLTLEESVALIRKEEVDILIDLKGWTEGHCMDIIAQRPAPILVHYIGWPGTTLMNDYILADKVVIPPENRKWFGEKVVYLLDCYQVNDEKINIKPVKSRKDYNLPKKGKVFACFNQAYKISPQCWKYWMKLLRESPGSVLWILWMNQEQMVNLKSEAEKEGIKENRIIPMNFVSRQEHLARMRLADIALETFPVPGHTTMSDCIRAGMKSVEFFPKENNTFIGNVAKSVWRNQETLFDTKAKTRQIEKAYEEMMRKHKSGELPSGFSVSFHAASLAIQGETQ